MQTTINEISPVEYELKIEASAEDLQVDLDRALRDQRARTTMKGFRPGKVPLSLVKRMYGRAMGFQVAEQHVQQTYENEVLEADAYDVLGQPKLVELDYELDGPMRAVIRFGVRPEIELKELGNERVDALTHEVTEQDVEEEIERLRQQVAELVPHEGAAEDTDFVAVDMQEVDAASGTPVIGQKEEDVTFFLDDDRLKEPLKRALLGKTAGDTFRVELPHDEDHEEEAPSLIVRPGEAERRGGHAHVYQVTVKEVKRRELPDLDEEFIQEVTNGEVETAEALRRDIREELERTWKRRAREFLEGNIIERMLALHPVPVPPSVVDLYLDTFVEEVKQRAQGELPESFDEEAFRASMREEAEKQGRWMLLRDAVIDRERLEATDDDLKQFFEEEAAQSPQLTAEQLQQFYASVPQLAEQLRQRLLSQKVFDVLAGQFSLREKDLDTLEREVEAAGAGV